DRGVEKAQRNEAQAAEVVDPAPRVMGKSGCGNCYQQAMEHFFRRFSAPFLHAACFQGNAFDSTVEISDFWYGPAPLVLTGRRPGCRFKLLFPKRYKRSKMGHRNGRSVQYRALSRP